MNISVGLIDKYKGIQLTNFRREKTFKPPEQERKPDMTAEDFDRRMQIREINMTSYRIPLEYDRPIEVSGSILEGRGKGGAYYAELPNTADNRMKFGFYFSGGSSSVRGFRWQQR